MQNNKIQTEKSTKYVILIEIDEPQFVYQTLFQFYLHKNTNRSEKKAVQHYKKRG